MARVPAANVVSVVHELLLAGHLETAADLLTASVPEDSSEVDALAVAAAEVALERVWADGTAPDPAELAKATGWDADLIRLRLDQRDALVAAGGRDMSAGPGLADRAAALQGTAPDAVRAGWAAFWHGVISDVLCDDRSTAEHRYAEALAVAESANDDLLAGYALRHIGIHHARDGNGVSAVEFSRRALEHRTRAGFVNGVLGQRLLHGVLLSGTHFQLDIAAEPNTARTILTEVAFEARALGNTDVADQAARFLAKLDGPD